MIAKRPMGKRLGGLWEFPGGKVEPDEEPEAALHRELQEELGCVVFVTKALPVCDHAYEWGVIRLMPFVCELAAGSAEPHAHEHEELAWVMLEELNSYKLAPADWPVVEMLRG